MVRWVAPPEPEIQQVRPVERPASQWTELASAYGDRGKNVGHCPVQGAQPCVVWPEVVT